MPAACLASAAHSARRQYRRLRSPAGGAPAARGGAGPACRCSGPDARTPKCLGASTWGKTGLGGPPGNLTQETRSHLPLSRQVLNCRPPPPAPGQMGETENDGSALGPSHADCRLHESKDRGYFVFSFFFFLTDIIQ